MVHLGSLSPEGTYEYMWAQILLKIERKFICCLQFETNYSCLIEAMLRVDVDFIIFAVALMTKESIKMWQQDD